MDWVTGQRQGGPPQCDTSGACIAPGCWAPRTRASSMAARRLRAAPYWAPHLIGRRTLLGAAPYWAPHLIGRRGLVPGVGQAAVGREHVLLVQAAHLLHMQRLPRTVVNPVGVPPGPAGRGMSGSRGLCAQCRPSDRAWLEASCPLVTASQGSRPAPLPTPSPCSGAPPARAPVGCKGAALLDGPQHRQRAARSRTRCGHLKADQLRLASGAVAHLQDGLAGRVQGRAAGPGPAGLGCPELELQRQARVRPEHAAWRAVGRGGLGVWGRRGGAVAGT
jgi:hypothetical protein